MKAVNEMVEGYKTGKGKKDMASGFIFGEVAQKTSQASTSSAPDIPASSTDGTACPNLFSGLESKPCRQRRTEVRTKFTPPHDASQNGERTVQQFHTLGPNFSPKQSAKS